MLIAWAGSSAELITYSHQELPAEDSALFIHEPRHTSEETRSSDPKLQEILRYAPEELLENALDFSNQHADIPLAVKRSVQTVWAQECTLENRSGEYEYNEDYTSNISVSKSYC